MTKKVSNTEKNIIDSLKVDFYICTEESELPRATLNIEIEGVPHTSLLFQAMELNFHFHSLSSITFNATAENNHTLFMGSYDIL